MGKIDPKSYVFDKIWLGHGAGTQYRLRHIESGVVIDGKKILPRDSTEEMIEEQKRTLVAMLYERLKS